MDNRQDESSSNEELANAPRVEIWSYPDEGMNWRTIILKDVIETPDGFAEVRKQLNTPHTDDLTRNLVRAVVSEDVLRQLPATLHAEIMSDIEAIIPLGGTSKDLFKGCYLVNFGRNHADRQSTADEISTELATINTAFHSGSQKLAERGITKPQLPEDVEIKIITAESPDVTKNSFVDLVAGSFAEGKEEIELGLGDKDIVNIAAVSRTTGEVLCTAKARRDRDTIYRGNAHATLNTYEIEGAKVRPEYGNQGLYTATLDSMYRALAAKKGHDRVDLVVGYSNATRPEVARVAGKMGRQIVTDIAAELKLPVKPAIKQTITDGKLVDEVITFMPHDKLQEYYGNKK